MKLLGKLFANHLKNENIRGQREVGQKWGGGGAEFKK